jgi:hypothetical protein
MEPGSAREVAIEGGMVSIVNKPSESIDPQLPRFVATFESAVKLGTIKKTITAP